MWMAQRGRATQRENQVTARVGEVTMSQLPLGVYVDGERRNLEVYTSGGYSWRPNVGDEVLVIKTENGSCVAGARQQGDQLEAGEMKMVSGGGATIYLTASGEIALTGDVTVTGEALEAMIRRIALDCIPSE